MELSLKEATSPQDVLLFTKAVLEGERNLNANLANLAALLGQYLNRINWVGFYVKESSTGDWVLGPFWGKPACTRIAPNHGVVGQSLSDGSTLVVPDVRQFPDHIACDADSCSEIVVPVRSEGRVVAGLDVDSPVVNRFGRDDQALFEEVADLLGSQWSQCHWY